MSQIGIPMYAPRVFGTFQLSNTTNEATSRAFLVTYLINNDEKTKEVAFQWEDKFIQLIQNETFKYLDVSFMTERSVEDEINRENTADMYAVIASYIIMFGYVAISLGQIHLM